MEDTYHRVDGVGKQLPAKDQPFNPRAFEKAVHGLQKMVLDAARTEKDHRTEGRDYTANHTENTEDGEKTITVESDTLLDTVCNHIPEGWSVSVLTDNIRKYGYAVRASVDVGEGVIVTATFRIQNGMFLSMEGGHTPLPNADHGITFDNADGINSYTLSRDIARLNRKLEKNVTRAFAATIDSAATAFDYSMTKAGESVRNTPTRRTTNFGKGSSQKEWANIRGKTQQTVSDNVRAARNQLKPLPDVESYFTGGPALEELDEDAEDKGDIRLV